MDVEELFAAFPWARFLPADDRSEFLREFVDMTGAGENNIPARVLQMIVEWRSTAQVHADPKLLAALQEPQRT
ncbi:hypothetical protein [Kribbella sp. NPDC051770]|uniref:hypothetical protein n=1 Tax=Kribbella sp. NPDC051770 TaxID=3155413 RepID=UPI003436D257